MDSWNDERLDELSRRMDEGFRETREGLARMVTRDEMKELIASINGRFEKVDKRFEQVDMRFEQVASKEDIVDINARLGRIEGRIDRLYFAFLAAIVALAGSGVAQAIWG